MVISCKAQVLDMVTKPLPAQDSITRSIAGVLQHTGD